MKNKVEHTAEEISNANQSTRGASGKVGDPPPGAVRTLRDTFTDERDDVLTVINELEDQLDRYEDIHENLETQLRVANEQNHASKQRAQELEWQVVTLQTRVEALEQVRHEMAQLEEEVADANARTKRQAEQFTRMQNDNARLTNELQAANKQLEDVWALRKERDSLRDELKNNRIKLEQIERAHEDMREERNTLYTRHQEVQAALEDARTSKHNIEVSARAIDDRNAELQRIQTELEQRLEALRGEKKSLQVQLTHIERENARLVEQQQFSECEIASLRSMNRNAENALVNVKKAFGEVRVALSETKARARRRTFDSIPRANDTIRGLDDNRLPEISIRDSEQMMSESSIDDDAEIESVVAD